MDRGAAVNDGSPGGESVLDMARRFSSPELQRYLAAKVCCLDAEMIPARFVLRLGLSHADLSSFDLLATLSKWKKLGRPTKEDQQTNRMLSALLQGWIHGELNGIYRFVGENMALAEVKVSHERLGLNLLDVILFGHPASACFVLHSSAQMKEGWPDTTAIDCSRGGTSHE